MPGEDVEHLLFAAGLVEAGRPGLVASEVDEAAAGTVRGQGASCWSSGTDDGVRVTGWEGSVKS